MHHFTPGQSSSNLILPPLNNLRTQSYTILPPPPLSSVGSPAITSFYTLWTIYPLTLIPIYPLWNPNAVQKDVRVLNCNFLKKFLPLQPHPYIILNPPSEKIPPQSYTILPPGQLNSYIILTPLNKLPPHSYIILTPLAAQLLAPFASSEQTPTSHLHLFTSWQSSSNLILPPLNNFPSHSFSILPPLNQLTPHYYTILPRWKPNAVQKEIRVLSCNFLKKTFHCSPSLTSFYPPSEKNTHSILHHFSPSEQFTYSLLHHFTPVASLMQSKKA